MDSAEPKKMTNKNTTSLAEMCTKNDINIDNILLQDWFKVHVEAASSPIQFFFYQ
jgi:hypothetical protein